MPEKVTAIIACKDRAVVGEIEEILQPVAEIMGVAPDPAISYGYIKERSPRLLFIDIMDDTDQALALAGQWHSLKI